MTCPSRVHSFPTWCNRSARLKLCLLSADTSAIENVEEVRVTIGSSTTGAVGSAQVHRRQTSESVQNRPGSESPAQEAQETPAVTRQEALHGDRVAQRKLARQQAVQAARKDAATDSSVKSESNEVSSEGATTQPLINVFA